MPLLRGIARTAVIAGTATAVSNRVSRRQAGRWASQDGQAYDEPAPADQPPAASTDQKIAQLKQLAELKNEGVITDDEFAAEKAKILNS